MSVQSEFVLSKNPYITSEVVVEVDLPRNSMTRLMYSLIDAIEKDEPIRLVMHATQWENGGKDAILYVNDWGIAMDARRLAIQS